MNQTRLGIDANIGLNDEVPLLALLALVHFRVALACLIFGRGRGRNERRIDNRSFPEQQAFLGQMTIDRIED